MPITANQNCESCLMPFSKDTGQRESEKYCSLCFNNGKLAYTGNDVKEFQKACYDSMISRGMNTFKARFFSYMVKFAPRWKKTN
jgi:hypothetical protein